MPEGVLNQVGDVISTSVVVGDEVVDDVVGATSAVTALVPDEESDVDPDPPHPASTNKDMSTDAVTADRHLNIDYSMRRPEILRLMTRR